LRWAMGVDLYFESHAPPIVNTTKSGGAPTSDVCPLDGT
jgi:hypothetical protein